MRNRAALQSLPCFYFHSQSLLYHHLLPLPTCSPWYQCSSVGTHPQRSALTLARPAVLGAIPLPPAPMPSSAPPHKSSQPVILFQNASVQRILCGFQRNKKSPHHRPQFPIQLFLRSNCEHKDKWV